MTSFDVDPWLVREATVDPDRLGVTESVFSLSNGHLGVRGSLDESEPAVLRATFLAGVFETHPLAYPEGGYGHPEHGQAMVPVTDGTPIRLLVDGVPLDVRTVGPDVHERTLDLRAGTLERAVRWVSSGGTTMELRTTRLVSLVERAVLAVHYEVRAVDGPAHVLVGSELDVGARPPIDGDDPRIAAALDQPFEVLERTATPGGGAIVARTHRSGIGVATAVEHDVSGGTVSVAVEDDAVVTTVLADLGAGESLTLVKTVALAWSRDAAADSLLREASAAVRSARDRGWDGLVTAQRAALDDWWACADVEVDGDPELQQAMRYDLFQLYCSAACISGAPVGAKGLTGNGYSGHTFWDVEGFVVPALTLLRPDLAERLLRWRAATIDAARDRAGVLQLAGASFAWRTIDGQETSAYWPASTAAMHVNADIARAFWLHGNATGAGPTAAGGFEVLVETARLWMSMGHDDADGGWHLFGMTGPDEYTGVVDDNVFTNLMARANLRWAADACAAHGDLALAMGVDHEEVARWRAAADAVHVPWDAHLGVHPANDNFTTYREWRFEDKQDSYPVQDHQHYAKFYRRQVVKQADLVQALWWCRDEFTGDQVARDLEYYEARTVRDSSLSAAPQAVVCAQAQHPDLALRYLRECALADLRDVHHDTSDGLHLASIGGAWLAFVAGLGGLREDRDVLELAPLLPAGITRTAYRVTWRGALLRVETTRGGTTITLERGAGPVEVLVDGVRVEVSPGTDAHAPLRDPDPLLPEPTQPVGREPRT